jgi:hypothetical protein
VATELNVNWTPVGIRKRSFLDRSPTAALALKPQREARRAAGMFRGPSRDMDVAREPTGTYSRRARGNIPAVRRALTPEPSHE